MSDRERYEVEKPSRVLREELYRNLEMSRARTEMERRRLIARLVSEETASRRPKPVKRIAAFGIGLAAAAAVAFVLFSLWGAPENRQIEISGLWSVRPGDAVYKGRRVRVPAGSGAKLLLQDSTTLWAAGPTIISSSPGDTDSFTLESGRVLFSVAKHEISKPFTVRTIHGEVIVRGTVFSVDVDDDRMEVRLHEGRVEIGGASERVSLSPGHEVKVSRGSATAARPIDPVDVLEDLLLTESTSELAGPRVPALALSPVMGFEARGPAVRAIVAPVAPLRREASDGLDLEEKRRPPKKRDSGPGAAKGEEPAAAALADPELAGIEVVAGDESEALLIEACDQVSRGNHTSGRRLLEEYLASSPDGRYWQRVKEIMGE